MPKWCLAQRKSSVTKQNDYFQADIRMPMLWMRKADTKSWVTGLRMNFCHSQISWLLVQCLHWCWNREEVDRAQKDFSLQMARWKGGAVKLYFQREPLLRAAQVGELTVYARWEVVICRWFCKLISSWETSKLFLKNQNTSPLSPIEFHGYKLVGFFEKICLAEKWLLNTANFPLLPSVIQIRL